MRASLSLLAVVPALAAGVLSALLFAGCGHETIDLGLMCTLEQARKWGCEKCPITCKKLDGGVDADNDAADDADAGDAGDDDADAADAADDLDGGTACEGQCVPNPGFNWLGPVLVAFGAEGTVPSCPVQALATHDLHTDIAVPQASCGTCACDPPVGSCTLPTEMNASTAICPGSASGAWSSSFDAPLGWDGSCTSMDAFAAGCDGVLCVRSLTIDPLLVTEGDCTPVMPSSAEPLVKPTWSTFARICEGTPHSGPGGCASSEQICVPELSPGFAQCIHQPGDLPCQTGKAYTERHVLYEGYVDSRGCSPCACGEAVGGSCTAKVSVFTDAACSQLLGTFPIDGTIPECANVLPAGSALGSKSAGAVTHVPGTCQPSGGDPTGSVELLFPTTFCCMPS